MNSKRFRLTYMIVSFGDTPFRVTPFTDKTFLENKKALQGEMDWDDRFSSKAKPIFVSGKHDMNKVEAISLCESQLEIKKTELSYKNQNLLTKNEH